jgi:hypothetical protein
MTQMVKRAPPLIPQQVRGIIDAERSQDSLKRDCDHLASMMPRNCCGIKGGARFTNCVIWIAFCYLDEVVAAVGLHQKLHGARVLVVDAAAKLLKSHTHACTHSTALRTMVVEYSHDLPQGSDKFAPCGQCCQTAT